MHRMHTAASHCSVAVWLSSSSRQTEGGEGRRKLAQRETGALISDGLTGCVDRAVAQEEEKKSNGGTSCLKSRAKHRSKNVRDIERGRGRKKERSQRGEKSFRPGRGSELEEADKDTERGKRAQKPSLTEEKRGTARTK